MKFSMVALSSSLPGSGRDPQNLIDVNGVLYGVSANYTRGGNGNVFSITPDDAFTVMNEFRGLKADGSGPVEGLTYANGLLSRHDVLWRHIRCRHHF